MSAGTIDRMVADARPASRRRGLIAIAVVAALGTVAAVAAAVLAVPDRVTPTFPEGVTVVDSDWGNADAYGVEGSRILRYRHDTDIEMYVPWDGGPVIDARLGRESVHLLTVTDVRRQGDQLVLTVHRDNCRYFHERAIDIFDGVSLTLASGGTTTAVFDRPLLVKSPMLASCPDRTVYRQDDQRSLGNSRRGT